MSTLQHVRSPDPPSHVANHAASNVARRAWTTEQVELLRHYAKAGLTCMQIAREIGVTRNAVIGKLNRLGLSGPPRTAQRQDTNAPHARRTREYSQRRVLRAIYAAEPVVAGEPAGSPVMSATPCTLLELRLDTCRWPINDGAAKDFSFCGNAAVRGLSYCAGHARLAYRIPAQRRAERTGIALAHS
jgi:GcrA cell cycle regulator